MNPAIGSENSGKRLFGSSAIRLGMPDKYIVHVPKDVYYLMTRGAGKGVTRRATRVRAVVPDRIIQSFMPWYVSFDSYDFLKEWNEDHEEIHWAGSAGYWKYAKKKNVALLPQIRFAQVG